MAQEEHASYLSHLKFDPESLNGWIARYLTNPRLLLLVLTLVILLGVYSFINLPRRLNPQINIPIVSVSTILPGAGPNDIETLVTVPLEDAINSVENIKTVTSSSRDSASIITVEFESGTDPDEAKNDIQSAIDGVNDLPEDALSPQVQKFDFENQPIWQFSVVSKTNDEASLSRFAKILRDKLKDLTLIDRVDISGLEEQEVQIVIKPEAIATYKLNPQQLSGSIKSSLSSFPAGSVNTTTSSFGLSIDPAIVSIDDLRELRVNLGEQIVKLSDLAKISQRSKPDQRPALLATPTESTKPAVSFNVYKTTTADITKAVDEARKETETTFESYPNSFTTLDIIDTSDEIEHQFNELVRDLLVTISLVFVVLFIFLGTRQAVIASFSIPLTFMITMGVMYVSGIALSFIAFFSLLLALGLLVDDTIVVISAMTSYYRSGKFTPLQTGLLVWKDFVVAIFTTTITTVWAFVPLLLSSGIIGEFIKPIPIVVSATLLGSFFIAMFITMPVMIILLQPNLPRRVNVLLKVVFFIALLAGFTALLPKNNLVLLEVLSFLSLLFVLINTRTLLWDKVTSAISKRTDFRIDRGFMNRVINNGLINFEHFSIGYQRLIKRILLSRSARIKTIVMVIIFSIFSYLLVPIGYVKNEFFPGTDEDYIYIGLELPSGTNLETSITEAKQITEKLRDTEGLKFVTAGIGQVLNFNGGGGSGGEANNVLFTLTLHEAKQRQSTSAEIAKSLREEFKGYQKGQINVTEVSGGPPAGAAVQIELLGDSLTELDKYADKAVTFLKQQPGTTNVQKSVKAGTSKLVFEPNKEKLSESGLDIAQIGFWLRTFASGFSTDTIRLNAEDNDERDITIRLSDKPQLTENINSLLIPTQSGNVPLNSLGTLKLTPNPTVINRKSGKRSITITSAVTAGSSNTEINQKLVTYVQSQLNLAPGYSWQTGGENEENQNSVNSILQAMILSFLLIILTMVLQFSSFRKALIVMLVIPLSISGVFIIFAISGTPLSFPALIGILALFGIVVKNSILVVDKISANEKAGMEFTEAIAEGSASRMEAITLTTVATIFGLIPITLSDPLWQGLGGAIIAGLTFSGTIMLFFIPVVYYYWFRSARSN